MEDLEDDIPGGGEAELIVCMHVSKEPMSSLGVENLTESLVEDVVPSPKTPELPYDEDELFDYEPSPVDEPDAGVIIREELASRGALSDMEEPLSNPVAEPADTLTLDGVVLNCESSIGALKAACTKLGLRTSGSKTRLFQRIKGYLEKQKLSLASDIARGSCSIAPHAINPRCSVQRATAHSRAYSHAIRGVVQPLHHHAICSGQIRGYKCRTTRPPERLFRFLLYRVQSFLERA